MPAPRPGAAVECAQVNGGVFAAITFNGIATDDAALRAESELDVALYAAGLTRAPGAAASLAQYNSPLVLPPVRRNEVLVQLQGFDKTNI